MIHDARKMNEAIDAQNFGRDWEARRAFERQFRIDEKNAYAARLNADDLLAPGTHATECVGSDRYAYEVVSHTTFKSGKKKGMVKTATFRELDAKRTDDNGLSESQSYDYTSNPENREMVAESRWDAAGNFKSLGGFIVGRARKYSDPSF